mgnify:FL=1|tara:strand:+ start:1271 stop:2002 length:732 start_codon:yes stop_codon:yes gene_type:complete
MAGQAFDKKPEIFVLGNGASLKDFDLKRFEGKVSIGCCLAYREWERLEWYPSFYVNVDNVVLKHQESDIRKMIEDKKCKGYLLSRSVVDDWEEFKIEDHPDVFFLEDLRINPFSLFKNVLNFCSGSVAALFACDIGSKVHLLGFDVDYVEMIPECIQKEDGTLIITKTPDNNPNYFIDDYQRIGDIYNKPNGKKVHLRSWKELSWILEFVEKMYGLDISVINYNPKQSIAEYFETKQVEDLPL